MKDNKEQKLTNQEAIENSNIEISEEERNRIIDEWNSMPCTSFTFTKEQLQSLSNSVGTVKISDSDEICREVRGNNEFNGMFENENIVKKEDNGIDIEIKMRPISDLCPHCLGSGKQKAMQMAMTYDAGTIRANDTKVKCEHCRGIGFRIKI